MRLRPLEPGPGEVAEARTEAGLLSLEQPALLSAIAPETANLAAGGAIAGRAWDSVRQPGRAAGVWAADGIASPNGGRARAIQNSAAGMVFGGQGVSPGVIGADERANGGTSLWGRAGGNGTGTGGGAGAGGIEAVGVEGGGLGGAAQGRSGETETGGPLTGRNDRNRKMDSGAAKDGDLDTSQPPAILASAQNTGMKSENTILLGTDPFTRDSGIPNWHHSDMDQVAYPYLYKFYNQLVSISNQ